MNIGLIFWCHWKRTLVDRKRYVFQQIPIIFLIENCFFLMICYKQLYKQESQQKCKTKFMQQNFFTNIRIVWYLFLNQKRRFAFFNQIDKKTRLHRSLTGTSKSYVKFDVLRSTAEKLYLKKYFKVIVLLSSYFVYRIK